MFKLMKQYPMVNGIKGSRQIQRDQEGSVIFIQCTGDVTLNLEQYRHSTVFGLIHKLKDFIYIVFLHVLIPIETDVKDLNSLAHSNQV